MNETANVQPVPVTPEQPVVPDKSSSRKLLAISIPAAIMVALAAGYFFGVPMVHANQLTSVEAKHKLVNDKLVKVYESFKRDAFTKTDSNPTSDKIDLKVGMDAAKDARAALTANSKELTKFSALPLLDWMPKYREAKALDAREEQFVKDATNYLKEYESLLTYYDKLSDVSLETDKATQKLDSISEDDTPAQITAKLDAAATDIQAILDKLKAMEAPDYIKSYHNDQVAAGQKLVAAIKSMSDGVRKLDIAKINAAQKDVEAITNDVDRLDNQFVTMLHKDSVIQKDIDALRSLNDKISQSYTKL